MYTDTTLPLSDLEENRWTKDFYRNSWLKCRLVFVRLVHSVLPPSLHRAGSTDFSTNRQMRPKVSVIPLLLASAHRVWLVLEEIGRSSFLIYIIYICFLNFYLFSLLSVSHIFLYWPGQEKTQTQLSFFLTLKVCLDAIIEVLAIQHKEVQKYSKSMKDKTLCPAVTFVKG